MATYQQLTREERYQISALLKAGHSKTEIARQLGRAYSTIKRELERNRGRRGYRPKQAHEKALARRCLHVRTRITAPTWRKVKSRLRQEWSPEQISGWLRTRKKIQVSHEWIYHYVYQDKARGGELWRHLRCQKQKRKRYGRYDRRGRLPNRTSIDERPAIVERRARVGDWELDTIIGRQHQQAIVSLVERKSKYTLLIKVERNTAAAVTAAILRKLGPRAAQVRTLTADNGREFAGHEEIAAALDARFYFAHPYHSWERGLNENTNGLVRQYFPKQTDFSKITAAEVYRVQQRLNHRPRKTLSFKTPHQVFFKSNFYALTT